MLKIFSSLDLTFAKKKSLDTYFGASRRTYLPKIELSAPPPESLLLISSQTTDNWIDKMWWLANPMDFDYKLLRDCSQTLEREA